MYFADNTLSDAEVVIKIAKYLNEYCQQNSFLEEKEWNTQLDKLCEKRKIYENGLNIKSFKDAFNRVNTLKKLWGMLSDKIEKLKPTMKKFIKETSIPSHSELAQVEINGKMGCWLEEKDALIFIEDFTQKNLVYYNNIENQIQTIWLNNIKEISKNEVYIGDKYVQDSLKRLLTVSESEPTLSVTLTKCQEKSLIPAYWQENEAREIITDYIDVLAYKNDMLALTRKELCHTISKMEKELRIIINSLNEELEEYYNALKKIQQIEIAITYIEKLRKIAPNLTSIDTILSIEGKISHG